MPFIGQEPQVGAYHVLDSITASATATYNLQLSGAAFSPACLLYTSDAADE